MAVAVKDGYDGVDGDAYIGGHVDCVGYGSAWGVYDDSGHGVESVVVGIIMR